MKMALKELAKDLQVGYQPRGAVKPNPKGTHWLIQMRDLHDDGTIDRKTLARFVPERAPDPYAVRDGDVLFQVRGASHGAGVVRNLPENTLASNHFYILRMDTGRVLPEYVAWYVNQPQAQIHLQKGTQGGGNVTVIPRAVFEDLEVPVPPVAVQEHIVALDRLCWRERELTDQLQAKRAQWVHALCMQAAESRTMKRGTKAS